MVAGKQTDVRTFVSRGKKWKASVALDKEQGIRFYFEKNEVGACPLCGKPVYAGEKSFYCSAGADNCSWTFPRTIKGARLTDTDMKTLLKGQKTRSITFTWRNGSQGTATLHLDEDGRPEWDFMD